MRKIWTLLVIFTTCMTLFLSIGYANLSDELSIDISANMDPPPYDVFISQISPETSGGAQVSGFFHTTMSARTFSDKEATFSVTVYNQSDKTYVFERTIDGSEAGLDGVYSGTDIGYALHGIVPFQDLAPKSFLTFVVVLTNPTAVITDYFLLNFNFVEKTGTEILPDPDDPDDPVDEEYHADFIGLVTALLSENEDCLNNSDLIYDAVIGSASSGKRPEGHAPILHCYVKSISGGTMASVAENVTKNLTENLEFIFEADPDLAHRNNRMNLYMYFEKDINDASDGDEILVYKQVVSRGDDGVWREDGTYIGRAVVGDFFDGGNNGKTVKTINPYTWKVGAPENVTTNIQ